MATNRPSIQQVFAISVALTGVIAGSVVWHYFGGDPWAVAIALQVVGMVATVIPVGQALLERIDLNAAPTWIEHSVHLGAQRDRVLDHYARIKGTLVYWKNQAAAHSRLHSASVTWSLLSAVLLPVLVQYHDQSNDAANAFLTMLTTWTGLVVAVASALKSEQRYQGMRQTESDY